MDNNKKLYRVNEGKIFAGICTGIAEYANMDVTIVRVLWVAMSLFVGTGLILYIICIFIIPLKPENEKSNKSEKKIMIIPGTKAQLISDCRSLFTTPLLF